MQFNPYPGLRAFEYKEFELFYGREGQAEEVLRRLQKSHFVAVVGTSGSGKSSLVRAGLLPLLYSGLMFPAGAHWRTAILRPGNNPIHNLARSLVYQPDFVPQSLPTEVNPLDINDEMKVSVVETILHRSAVGLIDYVKGNISAPKEDNFAPKENLLIVVDQFEELFRYKEHTVLEPEQNSPSANVEDKAEFVKLLLKAVSDEEVRNVYVVITMRSDYLGDCAQFRDLPEAINNGQYLIPRMTRDQLRDAIEEPVKTVEDPAEISELLVNRLLNDIGENQDQLPILQHALMRTWSEWKSDESKPSEITVEYYERVGGMSNALSQHADKVFNELSKDKQIIAEKMFRCLTNIDVSNRETRRETELGEICRIIDADISQVIPVIEAFRKEGRTFLMPPPEVTLDAKCVIDISHESLIRNWVKLNEWVADEAKSARLYRRLADDALLYRDGTVTYWRDPALQIALDWKKEFQPNAAWAERYHPAFTEAMKFLNASEVEREAQMAKDKEQLIIAQELAIVKEREATILAKSAGRLRWLVAALGLMFLISSTLAIVSFYYYRQAAASEKVTLEDKDTITKQNTELSLRIREVAMAKSETDEVNKDLVQTEKDLRAALAQAEESEKEQKRLTEEAQKARDEAEKNAEIAKNAENAAKEATKNLESAKGETEKTLAREKESRQALTLMERGNYNDAITLFGKLAAEYQKQEIHLKPEDRQLGRWWMLHNLGTAHWKNSSFDESHLTYLEALRALGENVEDPNNIRQEQNKLEQKKTAFIKTSFQQPTEAASELDFSKIATYRKLGQVNLERALNNFGEAKQNYKWAKQSYENFFSLYSRMSQNKDDHFLFEVRKELGDVYLALNEFDNAKEQFNQILQESSSEFDLRGIADMRIKLSEIEIKQKNYEAASNEIKLGIDSIDQGYASNTLIAEMYDARAKIYTQRSRAAKLKVGEIDDKLNAFSSGKTRTELPLDEKQGLQIQKEKVQSEQDKFSVLADEYSAVAAGNRTLTFPENTSDVIDDFSLEPYSDLADAYIQINKCNRAANLLDEALRRARSIASKNEETAPDFLTEQIFQITDYLRYSSFGKEKAKKTYLDFVDTATDEKVLQALIKSNKVQSYTVFLRYKQAGLDLQNSNPTAAVKYLDAFLYMSQGKAQLASAYIPQVIFAYKALGDFSVLQGDLVTAEKKYIEALEFAKNSKPASSTLKETDLRDTYIALGSVFLADFYKEKANKKSLARELYKNAADAFERIPATSYSYTYNIYSLKNLADIEKEENNTAEAVRHYELAIAKLDDFEKIPSARRYGKYFLIADNKMPAYYLDYASMLVSLVEIKGTDDVALVKKRDDAVKAAAPFQISNINEDKTDVPSCKDGIDPEFEDEKPEQDKSEDNKSDT